MVTSSINYIINVSKNPVTTIIIRDVPLVAKCRFSCEKNISVKPSVFNVICANPETKLPTFLFSSELKFMQDLSLEKVNFDILTN